MMQKLDSSCEPMDIDSSIHSVDASEVAHDVHEDVVCPRTTSNLAYSSPVTPEAWTIKTYHINLKTEKRRKYSIKTILAFIALCMSITVYLIADLKCMDELNLIELKSSLTYKVYDQTDAVDRFIEALSLDVDSKILFLYGSTGVGKTYTASLLLENIWNSSNIYHFTMPSFLNKFSVDNMFGINICKTSIVIVDDLKQSDLSAIKEIVQVIIKKTEKLKKKVTIILIINCDIITKDLTKTCDNGFYKELTGSFADITTTKKFINYRPLTQETLVKCVKDILGRQTMNDEKLKSLLNNFDVNLDGCKGVYKKVQFLQL